MKLTNLLIILCILLTFYFWDTNEDLAFSEAAFLNGAYYTVLTGIFVHLTFVHLIGNMIFLYVFGNSLEDEVGASRTAEVFFTGGILSFIISMPFYPAAMMAGASAAIFSVMAALLLVRRPGYSIQFLSPIGPLALLYFIFNLMAVKNAAGGNIAYISHVFGFIIGMIFGAKWNDRWKESLLITTGLLIIYIIIYYYLTKWIY